MRIIAIILAVLEVRVFSHIQTFFGSVLFRINFTSSINIYINIFIYNTVLKPILTQRYSETTCCFDGRKIEQARKYFKIVQLNSIAIINQFLYTIKILKSGEI